MLYLYIRTAYVSTCHHPVLKACLLTQGVSAVIPSGMLLSCLLFIKNLCPSEISSSLSWLLVTLTLTVPRFPSWEVFWRTDGATRKQGECLAQSQHYVSISCRSFIHSRQGTERCILKWTCWIRGKVEWRHRVSVPSARFMIEFSKSLSLSQGL